MPIKFMTVDQHQEVVERLVTLSRSVTATRTHSVGPEYSSIMACFSMHNLSAAQSLLSLHRSFGNDWFPITVGYVIVRSMFETDVTAHYISQVPSDRSSQYIKFEHVLSKRSMDVCLKHHQTQNAHWREAMKFLWQKEWASKENDINSRYEEVYSNYETLTKKGKRIQFQNWSGKSLRQMAIAVDHEEAYDLFYADLSSFTHVDVRLANKFLRIGPDELSWSLRASQFDVGNVFRYAAIFLTCFLEHFGEQFDLWPKDNVRKCWDVKRGKNLSL
jgi:hypothetical protein